MKDLDLIFCSSDRWLGRVIKKVTDSKVSHVATVLHIGGIPFIVDSQADGTRLRSFMEWDRTYKYDYFIMRNDELSKNIEAEKELCKYINKRYGYFDLVRHWIHLNTGIWLGVKREDKRLVCSEFVMRIYGVKDAYKMTPKDCLKWAQENNFKIVK